MMYKGLMDGWHGDEPEIEALSENKRSLIFDNDPEDDWDDRRRRDCHNFICNSEKNNLSSISSFDVLNKQIDILRKIYSTPGRG